MGTYVLRAGFQEQYYIKAQKIRSALRRELDRLFSEVDLLMLPTFPSQAFLHGQEELDGFQQKIADRFTVPANLAGIPALSFPVDRIGGLPVGLQFLAPMFGEGRLFAAAKEYRRVYRPERPDMSRRPAEGAVL